MIGGKCGLDGSLRAQAIGLQVREVHNMGHTTAEYFEPQRQRWH